MRPLIPNEAMMAKIHVKVGLLMISRPSEYDSRMMKEGMVLLWIANSTQHLDQRFLNLDFDG